ASGEGEPLGALALLRADGGKPLRPVAHDGRDIGEGLHVVDERGTLPQAGFGREGWTRARRAALAFGPGNQRRHLPGDESAGAEPYIDVEAEARAGDAVAQQAHALGLLDGRLEMLDGQRVLGAHVDVALLRAHGVAGDGHAFEHAVGVALQNGAIHESAGVAFIGIADDVLLLFASLGHGAPLQAGGVPRAAAAAQSAALHLVDDFERRHLRNGGHQGDVAIVRNVVFDALGIDLAGVFQHDPLLTLEEGHVGGAGVQAAGGGVAASIEGPNDLRGVLRGDVGEHLVLGLHRDQGTGAAQSHAADALDQDFVLHAGFGDFLFERVTHVIGAARETAGGDADADVVLELLLRVVFGFGDFAW